MKEAGGRARVEQAVVEYAPHAAPRADVRTSAGPGQPVIYNHIVVAHPFTTGVPRGSCGELLRAGAAEAGTFNAFAAARAGKRSD